MLDAILAEEEEANATPGDETGAPPKRAKQRVACNDCGEESLAPFHFVYHACTACRSYNTRVMAVVPPSEVEKEEANGK
jgi:zinc finger-like protein